MLVKMESPVGGGSKPTATILYEHTEIAGSATWTYTIDTSKIYCGSAMRYDNYNHNAFIYQDGTITNYTTDIQASINGDTLSVVNNTARSVYLTLFEIE